MKGLLCSSRRHLEHLSRYLFHYESGRLCTFTAILAGVLQMPQRGLIGPGQEAPGLSHEFRSPSDWDSTWTCFYDVHGSLSLFAEFNLYTLYIVAGMKTSNIEYYIYTLSIQVTTQLRLSRLQIWDLFFDAQLALLL